MYVYRSMLLGQLKSVLIREVSLIPSVLYGEVPLYVHTRMCAYVYLLMDIGG